MSGTASPTPVSLRRRELPHPGIDDLAAVARTEGHDFVARLVDDWIGGRNRFDLRGERLLGGFAGHRLVAVGGLNRDPYIVQSDVARPAVGRLRHVYVLPDVRGRGIAAALVRALLTGAADDFDRIRLRTVNPAAARLYLALGFQPASEAEATHVLTLRPAPDGDRQRP